jgi:hypothetical protein
MERDSSLFRFEQIHIDVARNSTDDFNPFHDPRRWQLIRDNPFGAPIVLGFQLESLVDFLVTRHRDKAGEARLVAERGLHFSNHEFVFAGVLRAGEGFRVDLRRTIDHGPPGSRLSNRVLVRKAEGDPVLLGTQSDTAEPLCLADAVLPAPDALRRADDRTLAGDGRYFLKRKFLNASNAKNFTLSSLVDQRYYIDELAERVSFPPMFTASLTSCALLEKAWLEGYDFEANPVVYTAHQISIDRRVQRGLRSNDRLHLLVEGPVQATVNKGLGQPSVAQNVYRCFGIAGNRDVLFRAMVYTAPLGAVLKAG